MQPNAQQDRMCAACGGRLLAGAAQCRWCNAPLDATPPSRLPISKSVHQAVDSWAHKVFGAPRQLSELITSIAPRDEVIERVVTEVTRRDVGEQRAPSSRRRATAPAVDPARVDPFAINLHDLRVQSEYVALCAHCGGAGLGACQGCAGGGRARCSGCNGSGKIRRYYKKSSRLINCKDCRGNGQVRCLHCAGSGSVTCYGCEGSGHQQAWLTWRQQVRSFVKLAPPSPALAAHTQLNEARPLGMAELGAFGVMVSERADGPVAQVASYRKPAPLLESVAAQLDARLERISAQQYLKLAIVRRDVSYAMCGRSGVLILSGRDLIGWASDEAMWPIRLRLYLWAGSGALVALVSGLVMARLRGDSAYFSQSNGWLLVLWLTLVALALPPLGSLLRGLRPRFGVTPLRRLDQALAALSLLLFVVMLVVGMTAKPSLSEVKEALHHNDLPRAQVVVDALQETEGPDTTEVRDAKEAVAFEAAQAAQGEARWTLLDTVAALGGGKSEEAAALANTERRAEIARLISAKQPAAAIAALDRWFGDKGKSDAGLREERGRAYDVATDLCKDDPACQYAAASNAKQAADTPARQKRLAEVRTDLLAALTPPVKQGDALSWLQRLRSISQLAAQAAAAGAADSEVVTKANKANGWAQSERAKVPVIGSDVRVASELLGELVSNQGPTPFIAVEGVHVHVALNAQKQCRGVYIVGAKRGARAIHGSVWTAERLLSQALGAPASVRKPASAAATSSRWSERGTPIVARWKGGELMELRIGDAQP